MLSDLQSVTHSKPQEVAIGPCKRFSGSFCTLDFPTAITAIEQKPTTSDQELPHHRDTGNSIFLASAKRLSQNEPHRNDCIDSRISSFDQNFATSKRHIIRSASLPVDENFYRNVKFFFLSTPPDSPHSPLQSNIKTESVQKDTTCNQKKKQPEHFAAPNCSSPIPPAGSHSPSTSASDEKPQASLFSAKRNPEFNLKKNQSKEAGSDFFKCRFCPKVFPFHCHLQVHERVHTKEKPYRCDLCPRQFSQLGSLTVHQRIHTGEMPYFCHACSKRFRHVNSLKRHQRQLHAGQPSCPEKNQVKRTRSDGEGREIYSCKKAKISHDSSVDQKALNFDFTKKKTVNIYTPSPSRVIENNADCPSVKSEIDEETLYSKNNERRALLENTKEHKDCGSSATPTSNDSSSSIFKSIEKLLSFSPNSGSVSKQTNSTSNFDKCPTTSEPSRGFEPKTSAFYYPLVAQTQTITTPTILYEANSIAQRPYELFLEQQLTQHGVHALYKSFSPHNLLMLSSLVFSDQFCKSSIVKSFDALTDST